MILHCQGKLFVIWFGVFDNHSVPWPLLSLDALARCSSFCSLKAVFMVDLWLPEGVHSTRQVHCVLELISFSIKIKLCAPSE